MIRNLIFVILFLKIFFRPYSFFIFVHTFQWTSSELFYSRFSSRESQRQQRQWKRSLILQYSFAQKTSLILRTSAHLTLKIIGSRNTAKNLSHFTNSPANMFLFGGRKNICTAPFLYLRPRTAFLKEFESKCLYISVYLPKKIIVAKTQ